MSNLTAPPTTPDPGQARTVPLLNQMLVAMMVIAIIFALAASIYSDAWRIFVVGVGVAECVWLAAWIVLHRGRFLVAAVIFFGSLWAIVTVFAALRGGAQAPAVITYVTLTIAVGLLWGVRVGLLSAISSSLTVLALHLASLLVTELLPTTQATPLEWWAGLTTNLLMSAVVIYIGTSRLLVQLWQTRADARELSAANRLLQERSAALEKEIAERGRVEAELRMMGGAVSSSPNGVIVADTESRIIFVNETALSTWGYERKEDLLGRPIADLWHTAQFTERMADLLASGFAAGDGVGRRRDGATFDLHYTASVIRDVAGGPELLYCSVDDASEQRRAERLLTGLNSAARAMTWASSTDDLYGAVSAELAALDLKCVVQLTDDGGRYLFPSHIDIPGKAIAAAEKLTSLSISSFKTEIDTNDAYRRTLRDREPLYISDLPTVVAEVLPGPARAFARPLCDLLGVKMAIFVPLVAEDRVFGLFSVHSRELRRSDLPSVVAFGHQLSVAWHNVKLLQELRASLERLKDTQAQLLQAQKMDAIGRLAGGVAHDFNNQLTGIIGYADLLLDEGALEGQSRTDVEEIKRTAQRAGELTRQLLAFSRKQILKPQVVGLNRVVEQMHGLLERVIDEKITLDLQLADDLSPVVADPSQLEQVIMNLVLNARDALGEGGTITLSTQNTNPRQSSTDGTEGVAPGPFAMLAVRDDGAGIEPELQERIFEPFVTTKEGTRGTGLGLATVYGIVRQSRGVIELDSEVGQGSTFRIYLPVGEADVESLTEAPSDEIVRGGSETILVAEDEDSVRALVLRALSRAGYTTLGARSGAEALALGTSYEGDVDLLLTDVAMPGGMDGYDLATRITAQMPMRVLFMSGHADHGIVRDGVLIEDTDFMPKPFTRRELLRRVRRALDA